jgi:hypothetical protein
MVVLLVLASWSVSALMALAEGGLVALLVGSVTVYFLVDNVFYLLNIRTEVDLDRLLPGYTHPDLPSDVLPAIAIREAVLYYLVVCLTSIIIAWLMHLTLKRYVRGLAALSVIIGERLHTSLELSRHRRLAASFVEKAGIRSFVLHLARSAGLGALAVVLSFMGSPPTVLVKLLCALAFISGVDASLIAWRTISREYGLAGLEVKEIQRFIAGMKRHHSDGGDLGEVVSIFPEEKTQDRVAWVPKGARL